MKQLIITPRLESDANQIEQTIDQLIYNDAVIEKMDNDDPGLDDLVTEFEELSQELVDLILVSELEWRDV